MQKNQPRFSNLAPFTIQQRQDISLCAFRFFSGMEQNEILEKLGKVSLGNVIKPMSSSDFPKFLELEGVLNNASRHTLNIRLLLESLSSAGLLIDMGSGGTNVMLSKHYYSLIELTKIQGKGVFPLSKALGVDFLYEITRSNIVHIIGTTQCGDVHAGSGLIVADNVILTCAHVITDMDVDKEQTFFNSKYKIIDQRAHPTIDVGLLYVDGIPLPHSTMSLPFVAPRIGKELIILGYPKIPYAKHAPLTMQRGEVTCESLVTLQDEKIFLFSAAARPGNSGGPILSIDGEFLGLVTKDLTYQEGTSEKPNGSVFAPHFAGVPSDEIFRAAKELDRTLYLPIEDYQ